MPSSLPPSPIMHACYLANPRDMPYFLMDFSTPLGLWAGDSYRAANLLCVPVDGAASNPAPFPSLPQPHAQVVGLGQGRETAGTYACLPTLPCLVDVALPCHETDLACLPLPQRLQAGSCPLPALSLMLYLPLQRPVPGETFILPLLACAHLGLLFVPAVPQGRLSW